MFLQGALGKDDIVKISLIAAKERHLLDWWASRRQSDSEAVVFFLHIYVKVFTYSRQENDPVCKILHTELAAKSDM